MNDDQLLREVGRWLHDADPESPDAQERVREAMACAPRIRQRGRWWPLPIRRRTIVPPSIDRATTYEATSIPATNGHIPTVLGRTHSMFGPVKVVVAGVTMALLGGLLLAGVLVPRAGDESVPAAVTASPAPTSTDDLLSGFMLEEIEPGVVRIVNDGVRDLTLAMRSSSTMDAAYVVAGSDGSVWQIGGGQLIRLGAAGLHRWPVGDFPRLAIDDEFAVGADGVLWYSVPKARPSSFGPARSSWGYDGESWERWRTDGRFATSYGVETRSSGATYGLTSAGVYVIDEGGSRLVSPLDAHGEYPGSPGGMDLRITDDGALWLVSENELAFYRDDGSGWRHIDDADLRAQLPPAFSTVGIAEIHADVSPSGVVWALISAGSDRSTNGGALVGHVLARFDGSTWSTWGQADGIPEFQFNAIEDSIIAGADDRVWGVPAQRDADEDLQCAGIAAFDGTTWARYLEGSCVRDYDIAPDGAAWVLVRDAPDGAGPMSLYVVRPPRGG